MASTVLAWRRSFIVRALVEALRDALPVCAMVLLQVWLFSPAWTAFFCGDSVYYLSRIVEPSQLRYLFTHPDSQGAYRPLTYLVFSWLFYPWFGLKPLGYHLAALALHLGNCLLLYRLFRKMACRNAAAVALFFFGVHGVNFYLTYDMAFLPDLMMMGAWLGSLLYFARYREDGSRAAYMLSLGCFLAALLSKETSIVLPATVVLWDTLLRRRDRNPANLGAWWRVSPAVVPFFAATALYLAWTLHIKYGLLFPGGVYGFTVRAEHLLPKLRYLAWLASLPTDFRAGWQAAAAAVLMLPAAGWWWFHVIRAARTSAPELLACALWAAGALLPVLVVTQAPMPHNLYMPLAACSLALAISLNNGRRLDALLRPGDALLRPGGFFWLAATAVVCSLVIQVGLDLRYSWVGEGSRYTRASLEAMLRANPVLPRGALLYVLPTAVRGNAAWYFDNGGLFRVFYHDPTIRMAFADAGQMLPANFPARPDVFVLRFYDGRLYDVTAEARAEYGSGVVRLLDQLGRGSPAAAAGRPEFRLLARRELIREAVLLPPGTSVRLNAPAIPAGSSLRVGVTPAGPAGGAAQGQIHFEHAGRSDLIASISVDAHDQREDWWDSRVDLSRWSGRAGSFVLSVVSEGGDWLAWSGLRIEPAGQPESSTARLPGAHEDGPATRRLLDAFASARTEVDPSEPYADRTRFETPTGSPAFYHTVKAGSVTRRALVMLAGTSVFFPVEGLPPRGRLVVSLAPALAVGDGMEANIYFQHSGEKLRLLSTSVHPSRPVWQDLEIPLDRLAGLSGYIVLECRSGAARDNTGDWLAWGRLRIETEPVVLRAIRTTRPR